MPGRFNLSLLVALASFVATQGGGAPAPGTVLHDLADVKALDNNQAGRHYPVQAVVQMIATDHNAIPFFEEDRWPHRIEHHASGGAMPRPRLCLSSGMDGVLGKPILPEELRKTLLEWLPANSTPQTAANVL